VLIERAFDATPLTLSFGKLKPLLAPVSRFWWKDAVSAQAPATAHDRNASPWICISYDEFKRRHRGKDPGSGTLDVLGQTARVTWPQEVERLAPLDPFLAIRKEVLHIAPVCIASTSASNLLTALEQTVPGLQLKRLFGACLARALCGALPRR
jgi:hypothetical protein